MFFFIIYPVEITCQELGTEKEELFLLSHTALKLFEFNELQHRRYHTLAHISI